MAKYTDKQLKEASKFVLDRVRAEVSMENFIYPLLLEYAKKIIDVAYKYGISPGKFRFSSDRQLKAEVDRIISELLEEIREAMWDLALYEAEDEDSLRTFLLGEYKDSTLDERFDYYEKAFRDEMQMLLGGAFFAGIDREELKGILEKEYKHIANLEFVLEAIVAGYATNITRRNGVTTSSFYALNVLSRNTIARGWMERWRTMHEGAKGFYSLRGSSYPCAQCDDMVGWHPIDEYEGLWHPNCKCIFIFT